MGSISKTRLERIRRMMLKHRVGSDLDRSSLAIEMQLESLRFGNVQRFAHELHQVFKLGL